MLISDISIFNFASTAASKKRRIFLLNMSLLTSSSEFKNLLVNFLIQIDGLLEATGGITAVTLDPSSRLKSVKGDAWFSKLDNKQITPVEKFLEEKDFSESEE